MFEYASERRDVKSVLLTSLRRQVRRSPEEWAAIFAGVAKIQNAETRRDLLAEVRRLFRGQVL
jgi:hypothetical protein